MSTTVRDDPGPTSSSASLVSMVAGIWLFGSPWLYGANALPNAWNSWSIGAIIAILAAVRLSYPTRNAWMSWLNSLLGIWVFASPFIFAYAGDMGRFVNSLCVGGIVALAAMLSASATPHLPMSAH